MIRKKRMDIYQLEYFAEACRQRSFARAAARLRLAPAALSEQMRRLEEEMGTSLFSRGRRETVPTAAGTLLLRHAESLLVAAEGARRAVRDLAGLRGGRLMVASIPSAAACLLPRAVAGFRRAHSEVDLAVLEGTSEQCVGWVESGSVELALVQSANRPRGLESRALVEEDFVALVPCAHAAATKGQVTLASLRDEGFVTYRGRVRETAFEACRRAGFEPRVVCESGDLGTVGSLVAAGLGVSLLPEMAAARTGTGCRTLRISGRPVRRTVVVLRRRGLASAAAEAFLSLLG
ncbi:MAG: LysR family transcriptional regulator [Verrucomicrobia bacterium]|nr:LysR family transcriptional regulator [Verrucomicrobiota bacterium]